MRQQLSKGALRARDRFFAALRTMSLRDMSTAQLARRIEHDINEALFQIERFAITHKHVSVRSPVASTRIAAKWLELAAQCVELDADLADVVTLFARHWLLCEVPPERARQWLHRAESVIRLLSVRGEHRGPDDVRAAAPIASSQPLITLVLHGLPRSTQPVDVEVDLGDGAVIGRADGCDWVLPGEVVSRHHAKLRYDAQQRAFFVANLSRNGIRIDDDVMLRDDETQVRVGTTLRIPKEGHYTILVQSVFVPTGAPSTTGIDFGGRGLDTDAVHADGGARHDLSPVSALRVNPRSGRHAPPAIAHALPVWADEVRDPTGVVQRVYEQYAFLPSAAGALVRDYVYGDGDASALVAAIFADVIVPRQ